MAAEVVFLDRDGTLNVDYGYVTNPDQIVLEPGAADAVASILRSGYLAVVVSNQSAIGRGMATTADVELTNAELCRKLVLENAEAVLTASLYCPHGPNDNCACRKPGTGMISAAGSLLASFDASRSWVIGDKKTDMEFGLNAGIPRARCLLLGADGDTTEYLRFANVLAAVQYLTSI